MAKNKFIGLYVDDKLFSQIEEQRGFETRSSFLERLIRASLN